MSSSNTSTNNNNNNNGNSQEKPLLLHNQQNQELILSKEREKYKKLKETLKQSKYELKNEKEKKLKLYKGLVKLASELKSTQAKLKDSQKKNYHQRSGGGGIGTSSDGGGGGGGGRTWYDGGMWRGPELLPAVQHRQQLQQQSSGQQQQQQQQQSLHLLHKEAVSLSDLFFDLVIVTAFTRVGLAVQDNEGLRLPQFFYFCIFWLIWGKEASFSTRFDTTDLSSQMETLLTCFAVLFGSLGSKSEFDSNECTAVMVVALFVALLHFLLHLRVWIWFQDVSPISALVSVKDYAMYVMSLTFLESLTWVVGIFVLDQHSKWRWLVFLIAILLSFRVPRTFLPNDFHAACSKRGVLFILTLGFILQNIVLIASPFFDYQTPNVQQFFFLGLPCFLLFCIKLLYVDDSFTVDPQDHALLVNRAAGLLFHLGQLALLLSTTILGAGLNLLTQSYLAGTAALPNNAKTLVTGGFTGVILSIGFIKSMHIRRLPTNPGHRHLFYAAYGTQILVILAVSYTTLSLSLNAPGYLGQVALSEIQLLLILCLLALFVLVISWLDEAVELNLYGESDASEFRVHPFGLWTCFKSGDPKPPIFSDTNTIVDRRMSHLVSHLTGSNANLFDSQTFIDSINANYGSTIANNGSDEDGERARLVKFADDIEGQNNHDKKIDIVV